MMTSYDTDKNGYLDSDELGKMRRPPKNADHDGDGRISISELIASVGGKAFEKS